MKPFVILSIMVCVVACHYDNVTSMQPGGDQENTIVGKWSWTNTSGGLMPDITPVTEGYTMTLMLTADFKFVTYKNGSIARSGSYSIVKRSNTDFIRFDSDAWPIYQPDEGLEISHPSADVLALGNDAADGPKYRFVRVKY